jgi:hypothetical protein
LSHPPGYLDNEFDNKYVTGDPNFNGLQIALTHLQYELIVLQYLKNLSKFEVGDVPPAELTEVACFIGTCLQFPRLNLQPGDARPEHYASLPHGHHLREFEEIDCTICHKKFKSVCDALAHFFGKSHLKAFRNQPSTCPTCKEPLDRTSVSDHIYTKKHLDARMALFTDEMFIIMPYWKPNPAPTDFSATFFDNRNGGTYTRYAVP